MDLAPLAERVRPAQVLLGVGTVLVVGAGAALASTHGGGPARTLLLVLAVVAAAASLRLTRADARSPAETTAACATGLALSGGALGGPPLDAALPAFVLTAVFLALRRAAPRIAVWPLAAWGSAQLGMLRSLDAVPPALHTAVIVGVVLLGLVVALFARPLVGRLTALTTAPWWAVGVLQGTASVWSDTGGQRWFSAVLVISAAVGLLVARLRWTLDVLLGPPRAVPVLAGLLLGSALAGTSASLGLVGLVLVGWAGVLVATTTAGVLTGWARGLLLPAALAGGSTAAVLCIGRLLVDREWLALSVLLLLTAAPTVVVALRRREDRPAAVPTAVLCLAGAVLLLLPDGLITPVLAAGLLTGLFAAATVVSTFLDPTARHAIAVAAIACAAVAAALLLAHGGRSVLSVHLTAQGLLTLGWAARNDGVASDPTVPLPTAWRIGSVLVVLGAWLGAGAADLDALEWYSLPAGAGLLLAGIPRLFRGPSWPAWGPGLLVAAVPSTLVAVLRPDGLRAVLVLVVAAIMMLAAARTGVRAPLMIGAVTAVTLTAGFTLRALPGPVGAAIVVGGLLLFAGTLRDRGRIAGSGARLAELR